jgi:hypothetical protein
MTKPRTYGEVLLLDYRSLFLLSLKEYFVPGKEEEGPPGR